MEPMFIISTHSLPVLASKARIILHLTLVVILHYPGIHYQPIMFSFLHA